MGDRKGREAKLLSPPDETRLLERDDLFVKARQEMVESQLEPRGITDQRVLQVMGEVPRHLFVPEAFRSQAYDDCALPIGNGQTISQPYMVAIMTQSLMLSGSEKVLEVGTGSGYQAAILGRLAREVYTIELIGALAERARKLLKALGFENVHVVVGNGSLGLPEQAPFDRILVTAGAPRLPPLLVEQLAPGGVLVAPIGTRRVQELVIAVKGETGLEIKHRDICVFVPLIGEAGWSPEQAEEEL